MAWVEYSKKPNDETEWEFYWRVRCEWTEEQLKRVVGILTEDQMKHFDVGRFEWRNVL